MSERIQIFDFNVDILTAILWQYDSAPNLISLLQFKQEWYNVNQAQFWTDWFNNVFNLQTANEFGLSVWAIILDLPLHIGNNDPGDQPLWGFGPADNDNLNFDNGNFADIDPIYDLTLEEQRVLLKLRYFQFVSRAAIPETNQFLKFVFDAYPDYTGQVYVLDPEDMSIRVVFTEPIPERLAYLIEYFDLIPRASGVKVKYLNYIDDIFGFGPADNDNVNFDNGTFFTDGILP